jgi:hypothetical protein
MGAVLTLSTDVSRSGAEANAQSSTHLNTIQDTRFNSSFEEVDHPLLKGVSDLYIDRLGKSKTRMDNRCMVCGSADKNL